jgi:FMN phosphatase YigB (HAD superfamily)
VTSASGKPVFLVDVDNTLLDNDRFGADLGACLARGLGAAGRDRYWALYSARRDELGYADYLGALQALRHELDDQPALLHVSEFLLEYPFARRLYPRTLEAIAHLRTLGLPVVLSDGDVVFQPRKIRRSGIWDAFAGEVLISLHKERELDAVQSRYPAGHYVMVDDKPGLLWSMKQALGARLTTVFVRQGHYALAPQDAGRAPPDITIEHIAGLIDLDPARFLLAAAPRTAAAAGDTTSRAAS